MLEMEGRCSCGSLEVRLLQLLAPMRMSLTLGGGLPTLSGATMLALLTKTALSTIVC